MSSWVRDIIFNICFFFHACLASGGVECLAIMTRYCYNTICTSSTPNHWEQVFHYPPAASYSCLFMPHNKGEMSTGCSKIPAQTALRSMDALIRHREWASSLGEKKREEARLENAGVTESLYTTEALQYTISGSQCKIHNLACFSKDFLDCNFV